MPHQRIVVSLQGSIVETRGRLIGAGWFFLARRAGCKSSAFMSVSVKSTTWLCQVSVAVNSIT